MKPDIQTKNADLAIIDCGVAEYDEILAQQMRLHEQRQSDEIADTVLVVEHQPVITLGARQSANRLLATPDQLAQQGIHCVQIRRGGGTTAHNPGQLVFYPILDLRVRGLGHRPPPGSCLAVVVRSPSGVCLGRGRTDHGAGVVCVPLRVARRRADR